MLIAYLVLAHLVGDFVFQTTALVKWKMKSLWGLFAHVFVHFAAMSVLLLPLILNDNFWLFVPIGIIAVMHFLIDHTKISYDLKHDEKVLPFLIDQLMHFVIITVVYILSRNYLIPLPEGNYPFYQSPELSIFASFLILVTEAWEIYRFQKLREKNKKANFKPNYANLEQRMMIFLIVYTAFLILSLVSR